MSGGRPLPAECARLAAVLRELRERTGLSLAALGGRTAFSKSSWERYLNGKKLPPREAVEALCALAGEPPARPLALWELAEQRWTGRAASAPGDTGGGAGGAPVPPPGPVDAPAAPVPTAAVPDTGRRAGRRVPGWYLVVGAVALAAAVLLALVLLSDEDAATGTAPGPGAAGSSYAQSAPSGMSVPSPPSYAQSFEPGCHGKDCEGADAQAMGCGAQGLPVTLASRRSAGGDRIEIRYAEKCGAVWAKATGLRLGDRVELTLPGADAKEVRAASRRDTEVYLSTAMTATDDPRRARVCLRPAEGAAECFAAPGR
ncbi:helix-turn-helix domain-containing protein [Streptomyces sp. NPDC021100]|uniref:helix-turn-helix domain-containing protein n=1 Tax=Streptomyces sp. NPDC021100 TaxID=3365114 RepID=UPI0037AEC477